MSIFPATLVAVGVVPPTHFKVEGLLHVNVFTAPYTTITTKDLPAVEAGSVSVMFALVVNF